MSNQPVYRCSLVTLVVSVIVLGALPAMAQEQKEVPKVTVEEFDKLRKDKDAVVLDVRTPEEFKAGHVPGAVNIDANEWPVEVPCAIARSNSAPFEANASRFGLVARE